MCEKDVEKCRCKEGFDCGALKKSFEFEDFCIFGNIMKNNTLVIRYNGHLKFKDNVKMYWVFNNDWNNIHTSYMSICDYDKNSYCALLHITEELNVSIGFYTDTTSDSISQAKSCSFKISQNTIDDIMKRYNFEPNEALPIIQKENKHMNKLENLFNKIKQLIHTVLSN